MTPNQIAKATEELKPFNLPTDAIPKAIHEREALGYVCIGIRSRDNAAGTAKVHTHKVLYAPISKWEDMEREMQSGRFKNVFNGQFNAVVILHNPKLPKAKNKGGRPKVKKED